MVTLVHFNGMLMVQMLIEVLGKAVQLKVDPATIIW